MCRYKMSIEMKYGVMNINLGDIYKEALEKYNKVKSDYANIPCKMKVEDTEKNQVLFIKENKENSFEKAYNQLLSSLIEMSRMQLNLSKNEKKYTECRNNLYHDLETTDLSQLSTDEQIDYLMNMKSQLNKRRIIEEENKKLFGFYESFTAIYDIIMEYEDNREKLNNMGSHRYGNEYYREDNSVKKKRSKHLLEVLNKNK